MARKPEATFRTSVHKYLAPGVYHASIGGGYTAGIPDVYYEGNAGLLFVEWKFYKQIPRIIDLTDPKKTTKLSKLQQLWLERAHNNGVPVAVIVGTPDGAVIFEGLSWQKPYGQDKFKKRIKSRKEVAQWLNKRLIKDYVSPPQGE